MITLIIGGARSGKSRLAEQLARDSGHAVTYIATATAEDAEMQQRIEMHQQQRPAEWPLVEAPLALAKALQKHTAKGETLLVDCLTLWMSNLLLVEDGERLQHECSALITGLPCLSGDTILVTNEIGMGVVPMGALSRRFCDEVGWLHQEIAALADQVILTVAGLPHYLKGASR